MGENVEESSLVDSQACAVQVVFSHTRHDSLRARRSKEGLTSNSLALAALPTLTHLDGFAQPAHPAGDTTSKASSKSAACTSSLHWMRCATGALPIDQVTSAGLLLSSGGFLLSVNPQPDDLFEPALVGGDTPDPLISEDVRPKAVWESY